MRNRTKKLIFTILTLVLSITAISPIYAYNGIHGPGKDTNGVSKGGYWDNDCGYRMYIMTETGGLFTDVTNGAVRDFLYKDPKADDATRGTVQFYHGTTISTNTLSSEDGQVLVLSPDSKIPDMPPPITWSGANPNGGALRTWMLTINSAGATNAMKVITEYFGDKAAECVANKKYKLVIEALFWYAPNGQKGTVEWLDVSGNGTGRIGGTIHEIALWESSHIKFIGDDIGDYMNALVAQNFPMSLTLESGDFLAHVAAPTATGQVTYEQILDTVMSPHPVAHPVPQGYGMHIYSKDVTVETNTTYDETKTIPAPPAPMPAMESAYESILRPIQIIKVYETISKDQFGKTTTQTNSIQTSTQSCRDIVIENEESVVPGYSVKEWITSPTRNYPSSWNDVLTYPKVSGGSGSNAITVPSPAKYIYIHLVHTEDIEVERVNLILNESEISRAYTVKQVQNWQTKPTLPIKFSWGEIGGVCEEPVPVYDRVETAPAKPAVDEVPEKKEQQWVPNYPGAASGHMEWVIVQEYQPAQPAQDATYEQRQTGTRACATPYILNDNTYTYALKNSIAPPPDLIGTSGAFTPQLEPQTTGGAVENTSAGTKEIDPDYKFIIYRGQDKPTLAEYKSTANAEITSLIGGASTVPHGNRHSNGAYNPSLSINLTQDQPAGDYVTTSWCTAHPTQGKQAEHILVTDQTYEGQATINVHETAPKDPDQAAAKPLNNLSDSTKEGDVYTGKIVTTVKSDYKPLTFYPYVQMTYQTTGAAAAEKTEVSVLSEQLSTMEISAAVAVKWQILGGKDPRYGLNIRSDQWSNHARATNGKHKWNLRNQVLPGGALYCVDTATKDGGTGAQVTLTGYGKENMCSKHITKIKAALMV